MPLGLHFLKSQSEASSNVFSTATSTIRDTPSRGDKYSKVQNGSFFKPLVFLFYILILIVSLPALVQSRLSLKPSVINQIREHGKNIVRHDSASGTPYKNCGSSKSKAVLKSVQLTPCPLKGGDHCLLQRGVNVTFNASFLSEENSTTLKTKIYGIIDYIPIPFPCPQPNACQNSGILCPISKGTLYNYTLSAPVLKTYPKTSLWIKGELKDDAGDIILCVEIPVKII